MSEVEKITRKELLQPNRMEKQLYSFVDHAYRKKSLYIIAGIVFFVIILGIWGGWKYTQNQRIEQNNLYHRARAELSNPKLSLNERLANGIQALKEFATSDPSSLLSKLALMESAEAYARQSNFEESIDVFQKVIDSSEETPFLQNLARLSLAAIYEQKQMWIESKKMLDSIKNSDWNDVRWRALARIAIAKGELEEAKTLLNELLEKAPDSLFRQEAEILLLSL